MKGKIVLVTGITQGIGKVAALEIARKGATVVLVARDQTRGTAARDEIRAQSGNADVELLLADLSSMAEVRRLADDFKAKHDRLHVLVNNAGAIYQKREVTAEGHERTFATNHLSYFLLTELLLERLEAAAAPGAAPRIVNVASDAHRRGKMCFDDLQLAGGYSPLRAYAQSKMANIIFTYELARRLKAKGSPVTVNALHPGVVRTGFGRNDPGIFKFLVKVASPFFLTPEKGAETTIYLASSPEVEGVSGKYWYKCHEHKSLAPTYDEAAWTQLWEISEKLVAK